MTPASRLPHETGLLLALQRVRAGKVTPLGPDSFVDHGRPFPDLLVPFLRELFDHGQVRLAGQEGDSAVVITTAGDALFAELQESPPNGSSTSDDSP